MKRTITYSSIIILTLLIGFAIGFLVSGRVTKQKIRSMRSEFSDQGFGRQLIRGLKPTPEQMEQLKPILREHARKHRETMDLFQIEQEELFQELRSAILPYLTEDQIERLDEKHKRYQQKRKHERPRRRGSNQGQNR